MYVVLQIIISLASICAGTAAIVINIMLWHQWYLSEKKDGESFWEYFKREMRNHDD